MDIKTFELRTPLSIDGVEVSVLKMREPIVEDALAVENGKGSEAIKELNLIANLCEVSPDDLKKLNLKDYRKVQKYLMDFL